MLLIIRSMNVAFLQTYHGCHTFSVFVSRQGRCMALVPCCNSWSSHILEFSNTLNSFWVLAVGVFDSNRLLLMWTGPKIRG